MPLPSHDTASTMETPVQDHNALKRPSDSLTPTSKKAKTGSSRTGQACDRCKIRKIRCDARTGGCSPCLQNNSECKTTDRITGRAIQRGHTENLENENTSLKMYVIELQAQLKQNGVEPGQPPAQPGYDSLPYGAGWNGTQTNSNEHDSPDVRQGSGGSLLPEFRAGCIGDNYLGVASENNWLSPIEGTSLALFGTKIDLAEFMPPEPNPETSAMSYQTFLMHAFGRSQAKRPELPDYEQCKIFAEWYFRSVQNFVPILHKPEFMDMLRRMYHEGYQTSPAETVMVHMMLAVMNFQWSARNQSVEALDASFEQYHYALTFIPQLITSHQLPDLQALTLICSQLRNQPRPGAAWMFTNMVLGIAIESGLHRSAKSWGATETEPDAHLIEMRKRIFWSILLFHVAISGKLGRPMPLRFEDFDIEIPEAVDDSIPGEANMTKWKKCSWRAAIQGFKLLKILMQVYSTIYSVRSSGVAYEVSVRQLEKDLQAFQMQVPAELSGGSQTREEDRVNALYLQISTAECELLLHHPSLCRSNSAQVASNNLELCLATSNKMLHAAVQLKQLKSLDTTWYYGTDFLAAIFTTLFAYTEKRDQLDSSDLQHLKQDMDAWLEVMDEVGRLLGTGPRLEEAVRNLIDHSVANISRHLTAKTASAAIASATSSTSPAGQTHQGQGQNYEHNNDYYSGVGVTANVNASNGQSRNYPVDAPSTSEQAPQYPQGSHYGYAEPHAASLTQYNTSTLPYNGGTYDAEAVKNNIEAQLNAELGQPRAQQQTAHPQQVSGYMSSFQSPVPQNGYQQATPPTVMHQGFPTSGPAAWRHFADSMMSNMGAHTGYAMSPTNAMLALQTGITKTENAISTPTGPMTAPMVGEAATSVGGMQMPVDSTQSWPLIHYQGSSMADGS